MMNQESVQILLDRASRDKRKGSLGAYEEYKNCLSSLGLSPKEYQIAIKAICNRLRV